MRCVVQRVSSALVSVDGRAVGACPGPGLVVLCGLEAADGPDDLAWMAEKIAHLRVFSDAAGKMNRSIIDAGGTVLLVPNFTVAGDAARGRRPSFDRAMPPERAAGEFTRFVAMVGARAPRVETGEFRSHMRVELVNDGPVTILLDSRDRGGRTGGGGEHVGGGGMP